MLKKAHICKKSVVVLYMFQSSGYKLEFILLTKCAQRQRPPCLKGKPQSGIWINDCRGQSNKYYVAKICDFWLGDKKQWNIKYFSILQRYPPGFAWRKTTPL